MLDSGTSRRGRIVRGAAFLVRAARLALPQRCALCVAGSGGQLLCADCANEMRRIGIACPGCALPAQEARPCGTCLAKPPPWSRATAALVYAFPVDRLLVDLKYGGRLALADWAGTTLAAAVVASLAARAGVATPERVAALPLAASRQRERGFNQAREIAKRVADRLALPLANPLERVSASVPQTGLAWRERARNVRGAFAVRGDVRGARIALVDDVMTTGATLAEATRTLLRAGAADVECWVVARTLPPVAGPSR
jgi:ComF family protein